MKKLIIVGALGVCTVASAFAADVYTPAPGGYKDAPFVAPNTWAGFYTGINAGYVFSNSNNIDYYFNDPAAGTTSTTYRFAKASPEGGFAGTQSGYNWQRGNIVFGVEMDFQGGDISGSSSKLNPYNTLDTYGYKSQLDWFGTVRARLGYAFGPALLYATGGFAYGQIQSEVTYSSHYPTLCCGAPTTTIAFGRNDKTDDYGGFVVGGGVEYAINPRWSIKAEYQYLDLGTSNVGTNYCYLGCTTNELHAKVDNTFNLVNVGLNYHIGAVYEPLK